jgi:3-phenylpropionate/cinnamic acid dioxygenase small subunit
VSLTCEDRAALHDLYARSAFAQDGGDLEAWVASFSREGRLVLSNGSEVVGHAELRSFFASRTEDLSSLNHLISNVLVEDAPVGATGRAAFLCLRVSPDGQLRIRSLGRYQDEFVQQDGRWVISRRQLCPELPADLVDAALTFGGES